MEEGAWGKVIRIQASVIKMRQRQPTCFLRTAPSLIGPEVKLGSKDKLVGTNTGGEIVQTLMAKDLSAHEFGFMTYPGIGKGAWEDTCEEVGLFIQDLRA